MRLKVHMFPSPKSLKNNPIFLTTSTAIYQVYKRSIQFLLFQCICAITNFYVPSSVTNFPQCLIRVTPYKLGIILNYLADPSINLGPQPTKLLPGLKNWDYKIWIFEIFEIPIYDMHLHTRHFGVVLNTTL